MQTLHFYFYMKLAHIAAAVAALLATLLFGAPPSLPLAVEVEAVVSPSPPPDGSGGACIDPDGKRVPCPPDPP